MWIGLVIVLAAAVGGGVYLVSLRSLEGAGMRGRSAKSSTVAPARVAPARVAPPPAPVPTPAIAGAAHAAPAAAFPASQGTVYVPLALDERPSIATRFVRLLGLIALVCVAGLILAVTIWQAASTIGDLLRHYLGGG